MFTSNSENTIYGTVMTYAVKLVSGPSLATLTVILWAKFDFLSCVHRKHFKLGVSTHFKGGEVAQPNLEKLLLGPDWPFLC